MPEPRQSERVVPLPGVASHTSRSERWLAAADRIADAYGLVLLLVMTTIVVTSLLPGGRWWPVVTVLSCNVTAIVALTTSRAPTRRVQRAVAVMLVTVGLALLSAILDADWMLGIAFTTSVILLGVGMSTVLASVVTAQVVDSRTLLGAVSVYTSMGLLFTFVYRATDRFQGGAFFEQSATTSGGDFIFFSYTTLTTTGYGNLVPADQPGMLFALIEMLTGQIFLVTLVAGLVTLWRPPRRLGRKRDSGDE